MTTANPASDSIVFDEGDLSFKAIFSGIRAGLAWGDKMMFSLVHLEPGGEVPEHAHPHEQGGICLEGQFDLIVDGKTYRVRPGQMYVIPGGAVHAARAPDAPAKTLDIFAPPREDYTS